MNLASRIGYFEIITNISMLMYLFFKGGSQLPSKGYLSSKSYTTELISFRSLRSVLPFPNIITCFSLKYQEIEA